MDKKRQKNLKRDIETAIADTKKYIEKYKDKKEFIIKPGVDGALGCSSEGNRVEYRVPPKYVQELTEMVTVDISQLATPKKEPKKRVSKLINSKIAKTSKTKENNKNKPKHMLDER